MIKVNFLKPLEAQPSKVQTETEKSFSLKKILYIALPIVLVLLLIPNLMKVLSFGIQSIQPVSQDLEMDKEVLPPKPGIKPKVVLGYAVEEIVREIQNEQRVRPRYSKYKRLKPGNKIEFQLSNCKKALSILKDATPDEVGYTDFVFTTPGDLYIHGMATTYKKYQLLKAQLSQISYLSIKPGILKPIGATGTAREFSFYGTFHLKPSKSAESRIITEREIPGVKSRFLKTASASGLRLGPMVLKSKSRVGTHKRQIFKVQVKNCSYLKFRSFINTLNLAKSKMGILKFSLKADGDEVIMGSMDVVVYTK